MCNRRYTAGRHEFRKYQAGRRSRGSRTIQGRNPDCIYQRWQGSGTRHRERSVVRSARSSATRLLVPRLMEHFTVYTYDRRGRGESGDTKPYAVDREIEDIEALIDHAGGKGLRLRRLLRSRSVATGGREAGRSQGGRSSRSMMPPMVSFTDELHQAEGRGEGSWWARVSPATRQPTSWSAIGTPPKVLEGMKSSPDWRDHQEDRFHPGLRLRRPGRRSGTRGCRQDHRSPDPHAERREEPWTSCTHPLPVWLASFPAGGIRRSRARAHGVTADATVPLLVESLPKRGERRPAASPLRAIHLVRDQRLPVRS